MFSGLMKLSSKKIIYLMFKIQAAITYVEVDDNSTYPQQTGDMNEPYQNIPFQGSEFLFRLISSFNF